MVIRCSKSLSSSTLKAREELGLLSLSGQSPDEPQRCGFQTRFFLRLDVVFYSENQERKILDRWILKVGCKKQSLSHKLLSYLVSLKRKSSILFTHTGEEASS